jgi:hypothetical protein
MAQLKIYKSNPHYLEFNGKPILLITSAEHYGAVINLDLDYATYLNSLSHSGCNLTRVFTGSYVEKAGSHGIDNNTLGPSPNKFIAPWQRSKQPGYIYGGNKFDLEKWDLNYFKRLKDFLSIASQKNIIVEIVLFSFFYNDELWSG